MADLIENPGPAKAKKELSLREQEAADMNEGLRSLDRMDRKMMLDLAAQEAADYAQGIRKELEALARRYDAALTASERAEAAAFEAEVDQALAQLKETTEPEATPEPAAEAVPDPALEPTLVAVIEAKSLPTDLAGLKAEEKLLLAEYEQSLAAVNAEAKGEKAAYKKLLKKGGAEPESSEAGLKLNETLARLKKVRAAMMEAPPVVAAVVMPKAAVAAEIPAAPPTPEAPVPPRVVATPEKRINPVQDEQMMTLAEAGKFGVDEAVASYMKSFGNNVLQIEKLKASKNTEGLKNALSMFAGMLADAEGLPAAELLAKAVASKNVTKQAAEHITHAGMAEDFRREAIARLQKMVDRARTGIAAQEVTQKVDMSQPEISVTAESAPTREATMARITKMLLAEPDNLRADLEKRISALSLIQASKLVRQLKQNVLDLNDPEFFHGELTDRRVTDAEFKTLSVDDLGHIKDAMLQLYEYTATTAEEALTVRKDALRKNVKTSRPDKGASQPQA